MSLSTDVSGTSRAVLAPPAWIFAFLVIPSAVFRHGFAFTALGSLLRTDGMKVDEIANVVAMFALPQMLYFVWSPLVDFWLKRRTWVAVSSVGAGALLGIAMQAKHLGTALPEALLLLGMCVVMVSVAGLGGLMAEVLPAERKTRGLGLQPGREPWIRSPGRWRSTVPLGTYGAARVWDCVWSAGCRAGVAGVAGLRDRARGRW